MRANDVAAYARQNQTPNMPQTVHLPGRAQLGSGLKREQVLRRYVDTAKFLDFIDTGNLFFCRADSFQDKFEGAFTPSLKKSIEDSYRDNDIDYTYAQFKETMRSHVFVNCWHQSIHDSAAMWALYGTSDCSVALTTTVGALVDCLEEGRHRFEFALERVEYINHWNDPVIDIVPYRRIFAYKTKAYQYEKEVRVLLDRSVGEFDSEMPKGGIATPVDRQKLLRSIVISPTAPKWYDDLIRRTVSKYDLSVPVRKSKLASDPI